MAVKILAASSSRWSRARRKMAPPMNTGGLTMSRAVRKLSSNAPASENTITDASA